MNAKVLIFDSDKSMCEILQVSLQTNGYQTRCFYDAESAFFQLKTEPFDIVITGLQMPGMSGISFC